MGTVSSVKKPSKSDQQGRLSQILRETGRALKEGRAWTREMSRKQILLLLAALGLLIFWQTVFRGTADGQNKDMKFSTGLRIKFTEKHEPSAVRAIPRIIHQTYKTRKLSEHQETLIATWKKYHPTWEYRFYDDEQCHAMVAQEFPDWLDAYNALPMPVERADFFRYLVVLRHGGVYADIDTECGMSFDDVIQPDDSFLAGWEDEFDSAEMAVDFKFARQRQALQWSFAGSPGHPVLQQMSPFSMQELCESIVSMAFDPVKESRTDALFRTGPGPFTDTILKHAIQHPFSKSPKRTQVRLLPRISLGGLPSDCHWVPMFNEPRRLLKHWGSGSWKSADFEESWTGTRTSKLRALVLMQVPAFAELGELLYPVSTLTKPAFTLMVQLKGHGDKQANIETTSQITEWGTVLPPGEFLIQKPLLEVFIDAWKGDKCAGKVLLDFGSGPGIYSLAAAANGMSAHAFELTGRSTTSLQASISYNGFNKQIRLYQAPPVGRKECVKETADKSHHCLHDYRMALEKWTALPVLSGNLDPLLQKKATRLIVMEMYPQKKPEGKEGGTKQVLERMQSLGFVDITHVGHICVNIQARVGWSSKPWLCFSELMSRGKSEDQLRKLANDDNFQWCQYQPSLFQRYTKYLPVELPELFLLKKA